ncbi:MAG: beta-glucosidase BglX [Flammeovirgaceae bacterium]
MICKIIKVRTLIGWFLTLISVACQNSEELSEQPSEKSNPTNQMTKTEERIEALLKQMTLEEKVGQLNMYSGSWEFTGPVPQDDRSQQKLEDIKKGRVGGMLNVLTANATREAQKLAVENSRLGIPLIFGYDVIHGYKTMLPIPLAQAASWNAATARLASEVAAREAAAAGLHWTFAPMIDISRDARWGRIMESAGEDPFLSSVMAKAWIEGYQGEDLSKETTIAACAKHFAAYGFAEAGRDYNTVDISENTLYNVVFPPFKAAVEAKVATFMNAFNDLNGIPATGSEFLQRQILKGEWNFNGFVVSDWGSIGEMITHGYASDSSSAALIAIKAGSDMDMESNIYLNHLSELVSKGKISESLIDDAVRRILKVKFDLGLFDDPYRYSNPEREKNELLSEKNQEAAREVARKTMVLLKNENNLLPLSADIRTIAVIGDLAGSKDNPLGSWRAQAVANSAVSLKEGIEAAVSKGQTVKYAQGYQLTTGTRDFLHELTFLDSNDKSRFQEAIKIAQSADVVIMAIGEDCFQTAEGRSQVSVELKGNQLELLEEILKVNKKVVAVLMTGRPVAIPMVAEKVPAILQAWHAGSQSGNAIADVLFGKYNPSGKLPVSFPRHTGQVPLYYYQKNTGRPVTNEWDKGLVFWSHYTDMPNTPQWCFGFGLSYTKFQYQNLMTTVEDKKVLVSVEVSNVGKYKGTETVQVYIRDMHASIVQPIKKLVAFEQIELEPNQKRKLTFELTEQHLGFYHLDRKFYAESGAFKIMVGTNSEEFLEKTVEVSFE